jgi:hypothetical protein
MGRLLALPYRATQYSARLYMLISAKVSGVLFHFLSKRDNRWHHKPRTVDCRFRCISSWAKELVMRHATSSSVALRQGHSQTASGRPGVLCA